LWPKKLRKRAIQAASISRIERLNGEDGLGAIYPPMANSVMMFDCSASPPTHPPRAIARRSVSTSCSLSTRSSLLPALRLAGVGHRAAAHAMLETGGDEAFGPAKEPGSTGWQAKQVLDVKGDWAVKRPDVRPGGWAFQYNNAIIPISTIPPWCDGDGPRAPSDRRQGIRRALDRGREWILGMQSSDGGWGAFDVDNLEYYLNNIPFSDHGALLDPPTEDVTARCVSMLAQLGDTVEDLKADGRRCRLSAPTQLAEGSWYGRWGLNYIYGTWSVLCALNAVGVPPGSDALRKAVAWLLSIQNEDGGWGEPKYFPLWALARYRNLKRGNLRRPTEGM
jgi:squalene-hopene/tetraprenyl-beta-curcumene cyclase